MTTKFLKHLVLAFSLMVLSFMVSSPSFGQGSSGRFSDTHNIYMRMGFNKGNYVLGFNTDLNYIYKNKYSAQIGYSGFFKHAESEPSDYSIGLLELFTFGVTRAYDQVHNWNLMVGRVLPLNDSETLRLHIRGGAAYSRRLVPTNWSDENTFGLAENYVYDYDKNIRAAIVINVELEWAYLSFTGNSVDGVFMVHDDQVYFGLGLSGSLGLLRSR